MVSIPPLFECTDEIIAGEITYTTLKLTIKTGNGIEAQRHETKDERGSH